MTLQLKQKATLFIPSPLHPDAYTRARELGFDVLLPQDLRNPTDWLPVTDAMVLRQGKIPGDIREAQKLKIIARNGTGYDMIVSHEPLPRRYLNYQLGIVTPIGHCAMQGAGHRCDKPSR